MKQLKDYLHLYLGCEVMCHSKECSSVLQHYGMKSRNNPLLLNKHLNGHWKPILRPLSDMTEEERKVYARIGDSEFNKEFDENIIKLGEDAFAMAEAEQTLYLLSNHFDLFGLIEAGLAIDANTLK